MAKRKAKQEPVTFMVYGGYVEEVTPSFVKVRVLRFFETQNHIERDLLIKGTEVFGQEVTLPMTMKFGLPKGFCAPAIGALCVIQETAEGKEVFFPVCGFYQLVS